jgi:hypothetical protein
MFNSRVWSSVVIGVFVLSLLCSVGARLFGRPQFVVPMGSPALLLASWAFFGYLVTLDDDAPGGWSNPERSGTVWMRSLLILAGLMALFGVTCWAVLL